MSFDKESEPVIIPQGQEVAMHCPKCDGDMVGVAYEHTALGKIINLKEVTWNTCTDCGFDVNVAEWKKGLFTV